MYAFIDESEFNDQLFFLSALIVREPALKLLEDDLDGLLSNYSQTIGTPRNGELHGYDLMQQKGEWENTSLGIASSIYTKAMGIINQHAAALYIEAIDREAQRRRYKYPYNHRNLAIGYLLERIDEYAESEGDLAKVFFDDHYTAPEGRKEFIRYKAQGTFGYKSSKLQQIIELDFRDSKEMLGLQASDLCTYAYQRTVTASNAAPQTVALQNKLWHAVSGIASRGNQRIWPE